MRSDSLWDEQVGMRIDRRRTGERRRRMEVCMMAGAVVVVPSQIREGRVCSASPLLYRER